jgi:hypothetical protein
LRRCHFLVLSLLALGCRGTLSPLSNKLEIGHDPYFVFVADGEDGLGDLFAAGPSGGQAYQITFTRLDERQPVLSPDGVMLAFLRRPYGDSSAAQPVIMNLVNGAERTVADVGDIDALAWSADGSRLYLHAPAGLQVVDAPPRPAAITPVQETEFPRADSAFKVLLGNPPMGEAVTCAGGGVCAQLASGITVLAADGRFPAPWGSDSLVYSVGNELVVRPLAGGATRLVKLTGTLKNPRQVTLFEVRK